MYKKQIAVLLALSLAAGALTACNTPKETTAASSSASAGTTAATEPQVTEDKNDLPMDISVMKPWINSNIKGMATDELWPDLKDDYYFNVNHDFLQNTEIRPGYTDETPLYEAMDLVRERCFEILNDDSLTGDDAERIQAYYRMFLDWDARNALGMDPVMPWAESLREIDSLDEMSEFLISEENYSYGVTLHTFDISPNLIDSSKNELSIYATKLSLEDSGEYINPTETGRLLGERRDGENSYMLSRVGYSDDEIEKILKDLYAFEAALAVSEFSVLDQSDPSYIQAVINQVTMEDIREMSPDYPLAEFLEKYGWADSELINVLEPGWLKKLNKLYTEENLPGIKAYVLTHGLRQWMNSLDEEAFRKYMELRYINYGISGDLSDEELAYAVTRERYPDCFARLYVEKYLDEGIREEIRGMCLDIADTYKEIIWEADWLSDETKEMAAYKLSNIRINAVYPDKWADDSMFRVIPEEEGGTYFQAVLDYRAGEKERYFRKINTTVDPELWTVDILETNAFYNPQNNSINIIPGFLCSCTYRSDMSIEEKYGALGIVIGHEISHAFDTMGSQFDSEGSVRNWWTAEDFAAFAAKADKLVKYYDSVVAFDDGTVYHGQLVQSEVIADLAGIKCMLKMAGKIDGFDYDRFFRAYIHFNATVGTVEYLEYCVNTDPHPLPYVRGNVNVAQFDEFIDTYDIHEGDGMYIAPEDRILIW